MKTVLWLVDRMVCYPYEAEINGEGTSLESPVTPSQTRKNMILKGGYTITTMATYSLLGARIFIS